jgi:RNA polymerase-binding transcription factor DksA
MKASLNRICYLFKPMDNRMMGKKEKAFRECEECGRPIESGNPTTVLCKHCAAKLQDKRNRDGSRYRPKDKKKKGKKSWEEEDF